MPARPSRAALCPSIGWLLLAAFGCTAHAEPADLPLVRSIEGIEMPESVRYDPELDVYFVSAIFGLGSEKDGNGYIVRIDAEALDRVDILARGGENGAVLDAPKGLALQGDTLWVADIDVLRGFHRRTGAPVGTVDFRPHGAVLLNDVALGPDGTLYITDSGIQMRFEGIHYTGPHRIFTLGPGRTIGVAAEGAHLGHPNGISWDSTRNHWAVVGFAPFDNRAYALPGGRSAPGSVGSDSGAVPLRTGANAAARPSDAEATSDARAPSNTKVPGDTRTPSDSSLMTLADGTGRWDGIEILADGRMLVTSWAESGLYIFDGEERRLAIRGLTQPADLGVDTKRNRVAIPMVLEGRVGIWQLGGR